MSKKSTLLALNLTLLAATPAFASLPVAHKSEGCVIDGKVFSLYQGKVAYGYSLPAGFNLKSYEGKKVTLEGELYPGDTFKPKGNILPTHGACDAASRKLIDAAK